MITKQDREILDNAPDGADFYITHSVTGGDLGYCRRGESVKEFYVCHDLADLRKKQEIRLFDGCRCSFTVNDVKFNGIYKVDGNAFFNASGDKMFCRNETKNIAIDTRVGEQKTVVDAVNYYRAEQDCDVFEVNKGLALGRVGLNDELKGSGEDATLVL